MDFKFKSIKKKLADQYESFRDQLIEQLNNSQEDAKIIYHMLDDGKIDDHELEAVKRLLGDIFKSVGLGGVFLLPGGAFLTVFLVKVFKYLQIEIMPSGFAEKKENIVQDPENPTETFPENTEGKLGDIKVESKSE